MNGSKKVEKRQVKALNKEAKITILSLLKGFYDEQIFNILIKDFYNSDLDISLAAIKSSSSLGNELAIPHLYRIIEHGKSVQKIAAIRTLAEINAPSSIDKLVKYFNIFQELETRIELLKAVNKISPFHQKVRELNKAILSDPGKQKYFYEVIVEGLLEAGELDLIKIQVRKAPPKIQRLIFSRLMELSSQDTGPFLETFREETPYFDPHTLGCYLCAYELKTRNPQQNFILNLLQNSDQKTTASFLITLSNYKGKIQHPTRTFRLLLRLPYVDRETEVLNGDFLVKIVEEVKAHSPLLLNEFIFTTATHLEVVFGKAKKQYISLKGVRERESLLTVILATIIERHATPELLQGIQRFFKTERRENPAPVIQNFRELLRAATEDDRHRLEACLPLFMLTDRKKRLNVSFTLSKINLGRPPLLRRLNRLIRVIGTLEIRNSGKKIIEILKFVREERVDFLEETCVVTLCQLLNRTAIEQAKIIFSKPDKYINSVNGYIRGARFIPVKILINPLLRLLFDPKLNVRSRTLIVDSLKAMNLQDQKGNMPLLIEALKSKEIDNSLKIDIADILTAYGSSALLQPILDLTTGEDYFIRKLGIRVLRGLVKKESNFPLDVLTNRLYILLEDREKSIQIESLLTLLVLHDDYALQILEDYVQSNDEAVIAVLLENLEKPFFHEVLSIILRLVESDNKTIQTSLRQVLPEICLGNFAEEIRKTLLDSLKGKTEEKRASIGDRIDNMTVGAISTQGDDLIEHAKLEFKFRRENSQILTVFFIDIVSYTEKSATSDTSTLIKLIQAFEQIAIPAITDYKGNLVKKMGDGLLAIFKHPLSAALAALSIQKKIQEYNQYKVEEEKFNVRIGLNTGLVIRKGGDVYGDTVNISSRMETSADPGDILLTQSTYDEIKEYIRCTQLGNIQVKGKEEAITAYSAEEILVDIDHIISGKNEAPDEKHGTEETSSLVKLKESIFDPSFTIPENLPVNRDIIFSLEGLFKDITGAVKDIARDYHEEYIFNRYLQSRWNQMISIWKKESV